MTNYAEPCPREWQVVSIDHDTSICRSPAENTKCTGNVTFFGSRQKSEWATACEAPFCTLEKADVSCPASTYRDGSESCPWGWSAVVVNNEEECDAPDWYSGECSRESSFPAAVYTTGSDKLAWGPSCQAHFCTPLTADFRVSADDDPLPYQTPLISHGSAPSVDTPYASVVAGHSRWLGRRLCHGETDAFFTMCARRSRYPLTNLRFWQPRGDSLVVLNYDKTTYTLFEGCLIPEWRRAAESTQFKPYPPSSDAGGAALSSIQVARTVHTSGSVSLRFGDASGGPQVIGCACHYTSSDVEAFRQAGQSHDDDQTSCGFWGPETDCTADDPAKLCLASSQRADACKKKCGLLFPHAVQSPSSSSDLGATLQQQHCVATECTYGSTIDPLSKILDGVGVTAMPPPQPDVPTDLSLEALTTAGYTHQAVVDIHLPDSRFDDWLSPNRQNQRYGRQLCDGEIRSFRTLCRGRRVGLTHHRALPRDTVIGTDGITGEDRVQFTGCLWMTWNFDHGSTVQLPVSTDGGKPALARYRVHWDSVAAKGRVLLNVPGDSSGIPDAISCTCRIEPEQLQFCPTVGVVRDRVSTDMLVKGMGANDMFVWEVLQQNMFYGPEYGPAALPGDAYHSVCGRWLPPHRPTNDDEWLDLERGCGHGVVGGYVTCGPDPLVWQQHPDDPMAVCLASSRYCKATACRCALTRDEAVKLGMGNGEPLDSLFVEIVGTQDSAKTRYLHWMTGSAGCGTRFAMTACEQQTYCGPLTRKGYMRCLSDGRDSGGVAGEACRAECECAPGVIDDDVGGRCNDYERKATVAEMVEHCGEYVDKGKEPGVLVCVFKVQPGHYRSVQDAVNALYGRPAVADGFGVDGLSYSEAETCTYADAQCSCVPGGTIHNDQPCGGVGGG